MSDPISQAINHIIQRDEDDNLVNKGLNELESRLFLKIQSEQHNCAVGESVMAAYRTKLLFALANAITSVAKRFEIDE